MTLTSTVNRRPGLARPLAALLLCATAALPWGARADSEGDNARPATPLLPAYAQECGACHLAYPPGLLPAASWQRLMADLPRHFGSDASLDPELQQTLARWLQSQAGTARKVRRDPTPPPQDRITLSPWFQRKHDEVPAAAWARPAVRSASNCAACHTRAEQGDFDERHIRIPR